MAQDRVQSEGYSDPGQLALWPTDLNGRFVEQLPLEAPLPPQPIRKRYCGAHRSHEPHEWTMYGYADEPVHRRQCPGRGVYCLP